MQSLSKSIRFGVRPNWANELFTAPVELSMRERVREAELTTKISVAPRGVKPTARSMATSGRSSFFMTFTLSFFIRMNYLPERPNQPCGRPQIGWQVSWLTAASNGPAFPRFRAVTVPAMLLFTVAVTAPASHGIPFYL